MKNVELASVKLVDERNQVVYEDERADFQPKFPILHESKIYFTDDGVQKYVGTIRFIFFSDHIYEELKVHFFILLAFNFLKTSLVAGILISLFSRTVTRPLEEMVRFFKLQKSKVNADLGPTLHLSRVARYDDEITELADFICQYQDQIQLYQAQQSATISEQEKALTDSNELIKTEKWRTEMNARLAQLGEMAAGIAHEINNPLQIISGYAEHSKFLLHKPDIDTDRLLFMNQKIVDTIDRISKIIIALRCYARDGAKDPFEPISITELFDDVKNLIATRLKESQVSFRINNMCSSDASIECRRVQIAQSLISLINNAFYATKDLDAPWVELSAEDRGSAIKLSVIDAGNGINPDVAEKIFQPFFTTKSFGQGTGLGLSIAFGIIREHQGDINFDANFPYTRFDILLPKHLHQKEIPKDEYENLGKFT